MVETVDIGEAEAHLSRLVARVEAGERIVIARAWHPVAELTPVTRARQPRVPGMDRGRVVIHDNFDDPLPDFEGYIQRARGVIRVPETDVLEIAVSAWEIAIKAADRRLDLPEPAQACVPGRIAANGLRELQLTVEHAVGVAGLPPIHRDPFDRVLVAQAKVEGIPIVTSDPAIARHDVDVIL